MADTAVAITAGTGTNIDTRTEATNGNHRQVIVLGDPATNAGVAPVDATAGLKVDLGADNDVTVASGTITAVTAITNALPAGTNAIGKLAANSGVDIGDVDVTSVVPGTAATNLGKAEDAAHTSGDVGVMALTVRQNTAAALSGTDADYQPLITDTSGRLHTISGNFPAAAALADAAAVPTTSKIGSVPMLYNGATVDLSRGNTEGTLLASAARTASTGSGTQTNHNARGVIVSLNVTAAGTSTLQMQLRFVDPIAGATGNGIAASATISTTGTYTAYCYPGAAGIGSAIGTIGTMIKLLLGVPLGRSWSCSVISGDGSSWTYSLAFSYVL